MIIITIIIMIITIIIQGGKCEKYSHLQEETFPGVMKVGKDRTQGPLLLLLPRQLGPDKTGPGPALVRLED